MVYKRNLQQWLSWQEQLHLSEIDLGLARIRVVAEKLDVLSPRFPIITVGGTNGKGSSVAMLEAILIAAGYTPGSYTSPHLIEYNERIKLKGRPASDAEIISAFERIDAARADISLTYFEFGTLAAMLCFFDRDVDVAILEVGLGGRLDAANLWDTSLAIITNICIDHTEWLGDSREAIAIEKAGIMRKGIPAICGDRNPPDTLLSEAHRINADLKIIGRDYSYETIDQHEWQWQGLNQQLSLPIPSLAGRFQVANAATVIAGLSAIEKILPVSSASLKSGLSEAFVLGRLQLIQKTPQWIVDVAHNPHAAQELANYLESTPVTGKNIALFSMLKDKDIDEVVSILREQFDEWHIFPTRGTRGLKLNKLAKHMKCQGIVNSVFQYASFEEAYQALKKDTKTEDRVVAFGSFLVVSQVLNKFK